MYSHYVPRSYLKGFSDSTSESSKHLLWRFDKSGDKPVHLSVSNAGGENNFYSEETEKYLANEIEGPTHEIFNKINNLELLNKEDKKIFSNYIIVMMKRVPSNIDLLNSHAPDIIKEVFDPLEIQIDELITENPDKIEILQQRRFEINGLKQKYIDKIPKIIWESIIYPEKSANVVDAISKMTWRFYINQGKLPLITCDNPVFYFTHLGIGKTYSELSLPISTNIVLWCSWRIDLNEGYFHSDNQLIKEFNRRAIKNAKQYVFSDRQYDWLEKLMSKKDIRLNYIR